MEKSKLIFWKNFLFRWFLTGLALGVLLFLGTTLIWDWWSEMLFRKFQISGSRLGELLVNSFLYLRLFLFFGLLAPAIALQLMIRKME